VADLVIKAQYEKSGLKRLSKSARFISKSEQLTQEVNCLAVLTGFNMPI
jgi:hypothetical protein